MISFILASMLANEEESKLINAGVKNLRFMLDFLTDALDSKGHRAQRESTVMGADELLEGLSLIPRCSESNIPNLIAAGVMPVLGRILNGPLWMGPEYCFDNFMTVSY